MSKRHAVAGITAVVLACLAATPPPPAGRSTKQIAADLEQVDAQIAAKRYPDSAKYGPKYKQQMGGEFGPLYERERTLLLEDATATPKAATAYHHLATFDDARLAFWGIGDAAARLDAAEAGTDAYAVTDAKLAKLLVRWWSANGDAGAQGGVVAEVEAMAAARPTSGAVADALHLMLVTNPASVALGQQLTTDLTVRMGKTPRGKSYAAVPNKIDEPLLIDGGQLTGKAFKSTAWAGKVVLVDFWATWCPPCREEIPHVVKVYQQYHDQGLEVVGVSSDQDRKTLAAFLQEHVEMPWPELFVGGSAWHPLTKKFHINAIPTMYLIDRNGNLRSTEAVSTMDDLIPILLAEPYTPPAPKPSPSGTTAKPAGKPRASGNVPPDEVNLRLHQAAGSGFN